MLMNDKIMFDRYFCIKSTNHCEKEENIGALYFITREVLKTEGFALGFQPSRGTLRMLMNDKIMFDRYFCIKSTNHCEKEENIGALYFITSSHFLTQVRYA